MILKRFGVSALFWAALLWVVFAPGAIALPAILVVEQGTVKVRPEGWFRAGWSWAARPNGSALNATDQLKPEPGSRAFVRCPSNPQTKTPIEAGQVSSVNELCNRAVILHRPTGSWSTVTGGRDGAIPYVITPRQGTVTVEQPRLQWNPVAGATVYTVTLRQLPDEGSWTVTTPTASIAYPEAFPPLETQVLCRLEVAADTGRASTEETVAGFNVSSELPPDLETLVDLDLPAGIEAVEQVRIYLEQDMGAAALEVLQAWEPEPEEVAVRQWGLGEVYGALNLWLPAEAAYRQVWDSAILPTDLGVATEAAMALGWLYEAEPAVSAQWWRRAELGAASGCDLEKLEEIWGQLEVLEPGFERPTVEEVLCDK